MINFQSTNKHIMVFAVFVLLLQLSCVLAGGKYDPISNEFLINVDELPSNPRLTLIPEISFEEGYAFLYSNYQQKANKITEIILKLSEVLRVMQTKTNGQLIWVKYKDLLQVECLTNEMIFEMRSYLSSVIKQINRIKNEVSSRAQRAEYWNWWVQKFETIEAWLSIEIELQKDNLRLLNNILSKLSQPSTSTAHQSYQYHSEEETEEPSRKKSKSTDFGAELPSQRTSLLPYHPSFAPESNIMPFDLSISPSPSPSLSQPSTSFQSQPPPFSQQFLPPMSAPIHPEPSFSSYLPPQQQQEQLVQQSSEESAFHRIWEQKGTVLLQQSDQSHTDTAATGAEKYSILNQPTFIPQNELTPTSPWRMPSLGPVRPLTVTFQGPRQPSHIPVSSDLQQLASSSTTTITTTRSQQQYIKPLTEQFFQDTKVCSFLMKFCMSQLTGRSFRTSVIQLFTKQWQQFLQVKHCYYTNKQLFLGLCRQYDQFRTVIMPMSHRDLMNPDLQKQYYNLKRNMRNIIKLMGCHLGFSEMLLKCFNEKYLQLTAIFNLHKLSYHASLNQLVNQVSLLIKEIKGFNIPNMQEYCQQKSVKPIPSKRSSCNIPIQRSFINALLLVHFEPYPRKIKESFSNQVKLELSQSLSHPMRLKMFLTFYKHQYKKLFQNYLQCLKNGEKRMQRLAEFVYFDAKIEITPEFLEELIRRSDDLKVLQSGVKYCRAMINAFEKQKHGLQAFLENNGDQRTTVNKLKERFQNLMTMSIRLLKEVYKSNVESKSFK